MSEQRLLVEGYIRALELATATHAQLAELTRDEICNLELTEDSTTLIAILGVEVSVHVSALTTAVAALAQLAAAGYKVPPAPVFDDVESR